MIRSTLILLTLGLCAIASAYALDFSAMQQQLLANPAVQQQLATTAAQTAASNPQMLSQAIASLTPQQQTTLAGQAQAIAAKVFTPAENTKLTAFAATPEGKGIIAKLPQFAEQLMPVVLQMYAGNTGAAAAPAAGK
jgi:hypothetical protein